MNEIIDEAFTGLDDLCGAGSEEYNTERSGELRVCACTKKPHPETELHYDSETEFAWWETG